MRTTSSTAGYSLIQSPAQKSGETPTQHHPGMTRHRTPHAHKSRLSLK